MQCPVQFGDLNCRSMLYLYEDNHYDSISDALTSPNTRVARRNQAHFASHPPQIPQKRKKRQSADSASKKYGRFACIIEARHAVTRYDLISCVNCSLVNCQSHSSRELVASICRYMVEAFLSLSPLSTGPLCHGGGRWPPPHCSPMVIAGVQ